MFVVIASVIALRASQENGLMARMPVKSRCGDQAWQHVQHDHYLGIARYLSTYVDMKSGTQRYIDHVNRRYSCFQLISQVVPAA